MTALLFYHCDMDWTLAPMLSKNIAKKTDVPDPDAGLYKKSVHILGLKDHLIFNQNMII